MCSCGQVGSTNTGGALGDKVELPELDEAAIITESEGIPSNDNDSTIPTSAAVKDYVDDQIAALPGDAVSSVNGATGAVVLDADDIDDSATTHKFTTQAEIDKLAGIEAGADITDEANVQAAGAVMNSVYDANSLLKADSDNTPTALTVAEQRLVGRITAGVIEALTAAQVRTLLNVEDGATADMTANEILNAIKTVDGSGSGLDADTLDGLDSSAFQLSDAELTAIANLVSAANKIIMFNGSGSAELVDFVKPTQYTPTLTNVANVASFGSVSDATYIRIGNWVHVHGRIGIDPTTASVNTEFGISLPIASNFTLFTDLGGTAVCLESVSLCAGIRADTTNDRANVKYVNTSDTAAREWSYHFSYFIK